jgi:glycosyltransferase involved in cell wall biosynthesis
MGGAAIASYRQHQALINAGIDSEMWVRYKLTNDPSVIRYNPSVKLHHRANRVFRRWYLKNERKNCKITGDFFQDRSEYGGLELEQLKHADVINIHHAWDFINYPSFFNEVGKKTPIVVTMHDMSTITAGCSYTGHCTNFLEKCGCCPILTRRHVQDLSRKQWERKFKAYHSLEKKKIHFVSCSTWLADEARRSSLVKDLSLSVIQNGVDTSVFKPLDRESAKKLLDIPLNEAVVAFSAASVNDERKGLRYLYDAIHAMKNKPFILTWGKNNPPSIEGVSGLHLGNIENERMMTAAYNAADLLVVPSIQDNLPNVILESMSCGLPVVAFDSGGISDMVINENTGLLCKTGSSHSLSKCIQRLIQDDVLRNHCALMGPKVVKNKFSMELNARNYINLYQSLIDKY